MIHEEDLIAFSKVTTLSLVSASLSKSNAERMKNRYRRSIGVTISQLKESYTEEFKAREKDEETVSKYLGKMDLGKFLESYQKQLYTMSFLPLLTKRFMMKTELTDDLRLQVGAGEQLWRILTKTDKNMQHNQGYYRLLKEAYADAFSEFAGVIELDVRRTMAAIESEDIRKKLSNILNSYAK
jgi:hypothetical protein